VKKLTGGSSQCYSGPLELVCDRMNRCRTFVGAKRTHMRRDALFKFSNELIECALERRDLAPFPEPGFYRVYVWADYEASGPHCPHFHYLQEHGAEIGILQAMADK